MSKAKCTNCGDVIESRHQYEFVMCTCYVEASDKVIAFEKTHGKRDDEFWKFVKENSSGFFLDGGEVYTRYGGNFSHIEWISTDILERLEGLDDE